MYAYPRNSDAGYFVLMRDKHKGFQYLLPFSPKKERVIYQDPFI